MAWNCDRHFFDKLVISVQLFSISKVCWIYGHLIILIINRFSFVLEKISVYFSNREVKRMGANNIKNLPNENIHKNEATVSFQNNALKTNDHNDNYSRNVKNNEGRIIKNRSLFSKVVFAVSFLFLIS